jgi:hypothetical protein
VGDLHFDAVKDVRVTAPLEYQTPVERSHALETADFALELCYGDSTRRMDKILRELRICSFVGINDDDKKCLFVYTLRNEWDRWRVFLEYAGRLWDLLVTFRPDYPETCPIFRFLDMPRTLNISKTGRFFNKTIRNYHPKMHVLGIIRSIRESLKKDNAGRQTGDWQRIEGGLGKNEYVEVLSREVLKGGNPDYSCFNDEMIRRKDYLGVERKWFSDLSSAPIRKGSIDDSLESDDLLESDGLRKIDAREIFDGVLIDVQEYGLLAKMHGGPKRSSSEAARSESPGTERPVSRVDDPSSV